MAVTTDDQTRVIPPDQFTIGAMALVLPEGIASNPADDVADNAALPVGTCLFEFEITGLIGIGGFGIVYAAYDRSLQRPVAIKEYMPGALAARTRDFTVMVRSQRDAETFEVGRRSFVNEARLLAQFDHPSLVKVFRFWEANGTAYMVMPLYKGVTLKQRLKEMAEPPGEAWLASLLRQLIEALAVIHAENCFHRDISPDNILLVEDDRPVLLDFGAARRVITDLTQSLTVILKPGYAPVEQYAEIPSMKQGAWTDVYALAAVVYFALTGAPPDPSVSRMMKDTVTPLSGSNLSGYSEGFLKAIDAALSVRPEDRPQSVAAFWALLDSHLPARPEATEALAASREQPTSASAGKKPLAWRSPPLIGALAAVLALGVGLGVFLLRPEPKPPIVEPATTQPPETTAPAKTPPSLETTAPPEQSSATIPPSTNETSATPPDVDTPVEPQPSTSAVSQPSSSERTETIALPPRAAQERPPQTTTTPATPRQPTAAERQAERTRRLHRLLVDAERAIARGDWNRAEQYADRALALDTGNTRAEALKRRAQAERRKAEFEQIRIE